MKAKGPTIPQVNVQQYSSPLLPDDRNLGGRIEMTQHMINHHKALLTTKPLLDTQKAPLEHINKRCKQTGNGKKKLKTALDFEEVAVSFKKVASMKKGYVDTQKPKSMASKNLRTGNFKRGESYLTQEHERNKKNMKEKIKALGKREIDRKKNSMDPIANPVRFFRRDPNDKKGFNLDFVAATTVQKRDTVAINNDYLLKKSKMSKSKALGSQDEKEKLEREQKLKHELERQ